MSQQQSNTPQHCLYSMECFRGNARKYFHKKIIHEVLHHQITFTLLEQEMDGSFPFLNAPLTKSENDTLKLNAYRIHTHSRVPLPRVSAPVVREEELSGLRRRGTRGSRQTTGSRRRRDGTPRNGASGKQVPLQPGATQSRRGQAGEGGRDEEERPVTTATIPHRRGPSEQVGRALRGRRIRAAFRLGDASGRLERRRRIL